MRDYKEINRDKFIEELRILGLHDKLLKNLKYDILVKIHELIGWAVPVFKPTENLEEGAEA
tara:strand:+ start:66 stop:248 length:183 start_codon:yes stop_codon:yes gene_type:complete